MEKSLPPEVNVSAGPRKWSLSYQFGKLLYGPRIAFKDLDKEVQSTLLKQLDILNFDYYTGNGDLAFWKELSGETVGISVDFGYKRKHDDVDPLRLVQQICETIRDEFFSRKQIVAQALILAEEQQLPISEAFRRIWNNEGGLGGLGETIN